MFARTIITLGVAVLAVVSAGRANPPENPTGALTLRDVLSLTLAHNPELAAFSWETRAREAEILQAAARPNPTAGIDVENFGRSGELGGAGASEVTLGLSQWFELGGKRSRRQNLAVHNGALAAWDYEARRLDVLTETTKLFVTVLVVQEQAALSTELVGVAERMLASVARRVESGGSSPVELGRARVELQTMMIDRERSTREVDIARQRLCATWGATEARFERALGSIETMAPVPRLEDIVSRGQDNPDLARWATEVAEREAMVAMERSRRIPDIEFGVGVRRLSATGDNSFVAGLTLPLPIFNRNGGATRAAERRVAATREQHRAASLRLTTRLSTVYQQWAMHESEVTTLRDEVLPVATETLESAQTAYDQGQMRLGDVLDTQRMVFALRARYYSALGAYHQTKADLDRLIGAPLTDEETR